MDKKDLTKFAASLLNKVSAGEPLLGTFVDLNAEGDKLNVVVRLPNSDELRILTGEANRVMDMLDTQNISIGNEVAVYIQSLNDWLIIPHEDIYKVEN